MINHIATNPSVAYSSQAARETAPAAPTASFAGVYAHRNALEMARAGRAAQAAAQAAEPSNKYAAIYAPKSGAVYAPRVVELTDAEAEAMKEKLKEVKAGIDQKIKEGFFTSMDNHETFACLYETYADAFGPDFMDFEWQNYAMSRPRTKSDAAKCEVQSEFYSQYFDVKESHNADDFREAFAGYFGYGDMTQEDRYRAILSDFSASGDLSYAGHFKMMWLLEKTGAVDAELVWDARDVLADKLGWERSRYYMTPEDLLKARYAYGYYGYDMAAGLLDILDHIDLRNRQTVYRDPNIMDEYNSQEVRDFFTKLNADTKLWLKDLKLGERFFVVARREAAGVPIGTSRPSNTATAEKIRSGESF